uniref:Uncharacterized protein n=1 Tax=Spongospora subterranea TaxID=70186 RepID=A0A0H5R5F1_9EUKA|eukprot:CRZ03389.1 hypothetical protein [Spongospora subterranea]
MNGSENIQRLRKAGATAFRNEEFSEAPSDNEQLSNSRLGKYDDAERDASLGIESNMSNHKAVYHQGFEPRILNKMSQAINKFWQSDHKAVFKFIASVNAGLVPDVDAELSKPIPPSAADNTHL